MTKNIKKVASYYKKKFCTCDPFEIAVALGIEVMAGDIGSRSGCYMYLKRSKCIWINESLDEHEKMFVMAHELGHAILHPKENCYFIKHKTFLSSSRTEEEANKFAVEFLIPDEILQEYMGQQEYTIEQMSRLLGYQKELIELRLK